MTVLHRSAYGPAASQAARATQTPAARRPGNLNGIAVDPASHDLLITGKYWPHLYRVRPEQAVAG